MRTKTVKCSNCPNVFIKDPMVESTLCHPCLSDKIEANEMRLLKKKKRISGWKKPVRKMDKNFKYPKMRVRAVFDPDEYNEEAKNSEERNHENLLEQTQRPTS